MMQTEECYIERPITNESLKSIIEGLQINPQDYVLSICASGDQAFAMLEKGTKVLAVDKDQNYLKYARKRLEMLKEGRFDDFLGLNELTHKKIFLHYIARFPSAIKLFPHIKLRYPGEITCNKDEAKRRFDYFSDRGRFRRIRQNAGNIEFLEADIFSLPDGYGPFTKAYLSNAWPVDHSNPQRLSGVIARIKPRGLLYITEPYPDYYEESCEPPLIVVAEELTGLARTNETLWTPKIYRKVN